MGLHCWRKFPRSLLSTAVPLGRRLKQRQTALPTHWPTPTPAMRRVAVFSHSCGNCTMLRCCRPWTVGASKVAMACTGSWTPLMEPVAFLQVGRPPERFEWGLQRLLPPISHNLPKHALRMVGGGAQFAIGLALLSRGEPVAGV